MDVKPVFCESHSHTTLCKHAVGSIDDYAAHAHKRGLEGLVVTCHCPLPDGISSDVRMRVDQLGEYVDRVQQTAAHWQGRVQVLLGMESDYLPGTEMWIEKLHHKADFHYILGSVHYQISEYRKRFLRDDLLEFQKIYFDHLAASAETGLFDCLAHPDLVKNERPHEWDLARSWKMIMHALDRIANTGVAMELNTSGTKKALPEMNPAPAILKAMREREIPVVLGSDAHEPKRVADQYEQALDLLTDCGYHEVSFFLKRDRFTIPIPKARALLKIDA